MDYKLLAEINTRVHPLSLALKSKVRDPKLLEQEHPSNQIKLLTYNIQMIPKMFSDMYCSGY